MRSKIAKKLFATSVITAMTIGLVGCGEEAVNNNDPTKAPEADKKPTEAPATPDTKTPDTNTPDTNTPDTNTPDEGGEDEGEVSPYTVQTDKNGNVYDLGGMEIIVRDWWSGEPAEPSNAFEEEYEAFHDWMQETYNFTLTRKAISDWASTPADFLEYATTGGDSTNYLFVQRPCTEVNEAMKANQMFDLATLDCLDFSEPKWVAGAHNLYRFGNAIYAMAAEGAEPRHCVYFNKSVLKDAGIDPQSLYDIQENMQWTWDKFEELCAKVTRDLDSDGVNDIWGYVGQDSEIFSSFVFSNGGHYVNKIDGKYVYEVDSQATVDGLRKAAELNEKYYRKAIGDEPWDYFRDAFAQGKVAFFIDQAYRGQGQLQENMTNNGTDFEWGIVCLPMGPNKNDYTNIYSPNLSVIPSIYDAQRAWNIAFAYSMWYEPVPGFEDYADWKPGYQKWYMDTESVDLTMARLKVNGTVTYNDFISGMRMGEDFFWKFGEFNGDPIAAAEAIKESWVSLINEANN